MGNAINLFFFATDLRLLLWGDVETLVPSAGGLKFLLVAACLVVAIAIISRTPILSRRRSGRRSRGASRNERFSESFSRGNSRSHQREPDKSRQLDKSSRERRFVAFIVKSSLIFGLFLVCLYYSLHDDARTDVLPNGQVCAAVGEQKPIRDVAESAEAVEAVEAVESAEAVETTSSQTSQNDKTLESSAESEDCSSESREDALVFIPFCDQPRVEPTAHERDAERSVVGAPRVLSSNGALGAESTASRIQPLEGARTAQNHKSGAVSKAYAPDASKSSLISSADFNESASESLKVGSVAPTSYERLRNEFVPQHPLVPYSLNVVGPIRPTSYESRGYTQRPGQNVEISSDEALSVEKINSELSKGYSRVCDSVFTSETHKIDPKTRRPMEETGCGFLFQFDERLFICTNNHVVNGAETKKDIKIFLPDSTEIHPTYVYSCSEYDLAALEVDARVLLDREDVNLCSFGDCNQLGEGHFVIAVGSPCLLNKTVTIGNIGGLRRNYNDLRNLGVTSTNMLAEYIQLSAMINPGNSGGPLINARGEVIGVTTASLVTNAPTGIAFAIPINDTLRILKTLITEGEWRPTQLGVELENPADLPVRKGSRSRGATIKSVHENSPAEFAGVKVGDVVITFNGREIEDDVHLARMIALADPNVPTEIKVLRNSKRVNLTARLALKRPTAVSKAESATIRR